MDFDDTPREAAFRADAVRWLEARAARRSASAHVVSLFEQDGSGAAEGAWVASCRAWQRTKWEGGYGAITWPKEFGGRGGTLMEEFIFGEEEGRFDVSTAAFNITLGMIAPTILAHGTDEQREHLPRILSGEEIWCQLFSEPGAGSDLAGLSTRAERDGDDWVVTGQKVWTS
ncbi:MAG TPA: acyl-CoA dehydrogenase family protein, partial [Acidimicrobiia bacterium]|nr:acyl-CoA dehydrogenase family protein [Acidimicrobiia bacterium]